MTDEVVRQGDDALETDAVVGEIESDLDETRSEMGETLSEIGERLDPARLADEAKQKVRDATVGRVEEVVESAGDTARGMSDMVMETIRQNPIPAALAGIGLALLWANRSNGNGNDGQGQQSYANRDEGMNSAKHGAADIADKVGSTAGDAVENVQQLAQDATYNARQGAGEVVGQAQRIMNESPLVAGIAALGAGAAVGVLLPNTPLEKEYLGEPSSAVISAAADAASELGSKAEQSLDNAREPQVATV